MYSIKEINQNNGTSYIRITRDNDPVIINSSFSIVNFDISLFDPETGNYNCEDCDNCIACINCKDCTNCYRCNNCAYCLDCDGNDNYYCIESGHGFPDKIRSDYSEKQHKKIIESLCRILDCHESEIIDKVKSLNDENNKL